MAYVRKHKPIRSIPKIVKEKPKKEKIKKPKKESITKLEHKLDAVFSKFIRIRDAIKTTGSKDHLICYTCDKYLPVKEGQNMHFCSRRHKILRWDEDNCKWGCVWCNVMLHWNYIVYTRRMQNEYWIDKIDELISKSHTTFRPSREFLEEKIEYYEKQLTILSK